MAVPEHVDLKVDSSGQSSKNNSVSEAETKLPCREGDQISKSDLSIETPEEKTSEVNVKSSNLNPMAEEYVPLSLAQTQFVFWYPNNFAVQQPIFASENGYFARRRNNSGQGKKRMNKKTSLAQNEDVIKRTVFVSEIDQQITEEQLAGLFLSCGKVVDCRICGENRSVLRFAFLEFSDEEGAKSALRLSGTVFGSRMLKVRLSKTAIEPVNPTFLPNSEDEREKCAKTIYCTNIDKQVTQMELVDFFRAVCGEIQHIRLLGDSHRATRIAFIEFKLAESATAALNCCGVILGGFPVRISPSKTPVRPHQSDKNQN